MTETHPMNKWLGAPFLKHVQGPQLLELLRFARSKGLSGEMECAIGGGQVKMIHLDQGSIREDQAVVKGLVGEASMVLAWMPRTETKIAHSAEHAEESIALLVPNMEEILIQFCQQDLKVTDAWAGVVQGSSPIAFSGQSGATATALPISGMAAQLNASLDIIESAGAMQGMTIHTGQTQFGVEILIPGWFFVYSCDSSRRDHINLVVEALQNTLKRHGVQATHGDSLCSQFVSENVGRYAMLQPDKHNKCCSEIARCFGEEQIAWNQFWYQKKLPVVVQYDRHLEMTQEIEGSVAKDLLLVRDTVQNFFGAEVNSFSVRTADRAICFEILAEREFYAIDLQCSFYDASFEAKTHKLVGLMRDAHDAYFAQRAM